MRIVVDTNVVISGIFFRGNPSRIIDSVADNLFEVCVTSEIVDEYREVAERMIDRHQGVFRARDFDDLVSKLRIIEPMTRVAVCRDPDDDKFISCAIDSRAVYIVSGDKDLLSIGEYAGIEIVTASQFCGRYL